MCVYVYGPRCPCKCMSATEKARIQLCACSRLGLSVSNGLKFYLQDHLVFGFWVCFGFVCLFVLFWLEYMCVRIVSVNACDRPNTLVNVDIPCAFCLVALHDILPLPLHVCM